LSIIKEIRLKEGPPLPAFQGQSRSSEPEQKVKFLLTFHINNGHIFQSKIANSFHPHVFNTSAEGVP